MDGNFPITPTSAVIVSQIALVPAWIVGLLAMALPLTLVWRYRREERAGGRKSHEPAGQPPG